MERLKISSNFFLDLEIKKVFPGVERLRVFEKYLPGVEIGNFRKVFSECGEIKYFMGLESLKMLESILCCVGD